MSKQSRKSTRQLVKNIKDTYNKTKYVKEIDAQSLTIKNAIK